MRESAPTLPSHHRQPTPKKQHDHDGALFSYTRPSRPHGLDSHALLSLLVVLFFSSSVLVAVSAAETYGDRFAPWMHQDSLEWKGSSLLIDQRPPPVIPGLMPSQRHDDATRTLSAPLSKRSIDTDPNVVQNDFVIPQPFDTGLSNNFTSSCSGFLNRMRTNDDFKNCHPFSLMLMVCWINPNALVLQLTDDRHRVGFSTPPNLIFTSLKRSMQLAVQM